MEHASDSCLRGHRIRSGSTSATRPEPCSFTRWKRTSSSSSIVIRVPTKSQFSGRRTASGSPTLAKRKVDRRVRSVDLQRLEWYQAEDHERILHRFFPCLRSKRGALVLRIESGYQRSSIRRSRNHLYLLGHSDSDGDATAARCSMATEAGER